MKSEATVKAKVENLLNPLFVEAEQLFAEVESIEKAISQRAYDFFEQRGGKAGNDLEDWLLAESQVLRFLPLEMKEAEGVLTITAEVPGFSAEDIKISVADNRLIINGKSEKTDTKKEDGNIIFSERSSNQFLRELTLPAKVDLAKAEAKLKDGILSLTLPKLALAESETKQLEVKAN